MFPLLRYPAVVICSPMRRFNAGAETRRQRLHLAATFAIEVQEISAGVSQDDTHVLRYKRHLQQKLGLEQRHCNKGCAIMRHHCITSPCMRLLGRPPSKNQCITFAALLAQVLTSFQRRKSQMCVERRPSVNERGRGDPGLSINHGYPNHPEKGGFMFFMLFLIHGETERSICTVALDRPHMETARLNKRMAVKDRYCTQGRQHMQSSPTISDRLEFLLHVIVT